MQSTNYRSMDLKDLQKLFKETKEHSREWHIIKRIVEDRVANNFLQYILS